MLSTYVYCICSFLLAIGGELLCHMYPDHAVVVKLDKIFAFGLLGLLACFFVIENNDVRK